MKRIFSYFTIIFITFIVCAYLQGSDPEFRPPAPPPSPVHADPINQQEQLVEDRKSPTSHSQSELEHASEGSSHASSDHQERINALRKQSMRANQPTAKKSIVREPASNPWSFNLRAHHLEYLGGAVTAVSLVTLFMKSGNTSQTKRSGMPTDAVAVGYQVGTTALSILSNLGLKGVVCIGGLYGGYKLKRWIHAGCRSDLQKAKDEFENLLNEHIADDNERLIETTKKDEDLCNALDGIVAAVTLMNQREERTVMLLMKMSQTLPSEAQTVLLRMLTADEQTLFNNHMNSLTAERLADVQPKQLAHSRPKLIATKDSNHPIAAMPTLIPHGPTSLTVDPIADETAKINQILHGVQGITNGVRKDNQETLSRPLPPKLPKEKICCSKWGCC